MEHSLSGLYEETLKRQFSRLNRDNFTVQLELKRVFVCGGIVNPITSPDLIPGSFRDRLIRFTAERNIAFHDYIILAEEFKDYYADGNYDDLLTFEDDIARLCTLVIIFLESPGSLVELGLYSCREAFLKKLLIVVPHEEIKSEDSFIYLGPLKYIESKTGNPHCAYPFPSNEIGAYDPYYLEDLCHNIDERIKSAHREEAFEENSGHVAFLIAEIVRLCFPIMKGEIELALNVLGIDTKKSTVNRLIYLLLKMSFIGKERESTNVYYFPINKDEKLVNFGRTREDKRTDDSAFTLAMRQSFVIEKSQLARRRTRVLQRVIEKNKGGSS